MKIELYRAVQTKYLGSTHVHVCPRTDDALIWRDQTYRVVDVAHPTEDTEGLGICVPRVAVVVEDIPWLDIR